MDYQLEGTIKLINEAQTFPSGFTKREFVVVTDEERYPQTIKFEAIKDKCALLDGYQEGDRVNVRFNIRGSEHNGRYYVNLQAWKLEKPGEGGSEQGGGGEGGAPRSHPPRQERPPRQAQERDDRRGGERDDWRGGRDRGPRGRDRGDQRERDRRGKGGGKPRQDFAPPAYEEIDDEDRF